MRRGDIMQSAASESRGWGGLRRPALHLLWAVPVAILVSVPFAALSGLAWGAIGGCSPSFLGVDPEHLGLALVGCTGAAVVFMLPLLIVPWLTVRSGRIILAIVAGVLYALGVALVTHGQCPWLP